MKVAMPKDREPVEIDPADPLLLEQIGRLRVLAWSTVMPDAASRTESWLDEFELRARHWCIFHAGKPVAAARLSIHRRIDEVPDAEIFEGVVVDPPAPVASLNRLVIHPEFRGRGWAERLDKVRILAAAAAGCRCAVGETQSPRRVRQLEDAGFRVVGPCRPYAPGNFLADFPGVVVYCPLPRYRSA